MALGEPYRRNGSAAYATGGSAHRFGFLGVTALPLSKAVAAHVRSSIASLCDAGRSFRSALDVYPAQRRQQDVHNMESAIKLAEADLPELRARTNAPSDS